MSDSDEDVSGDEGDEAGEEAGEGGEVKGEMDEEEELKMQHLEDRTKRASLSDPPVTLDRDMVRDGLSQIGKTVDGLGYAYLRLVVNDKSLTDITIIRHYTNLLFVDFCGNRLTDEDLLLLTSMRDLLMIRLDRNYVTSPVMPAMRYLQVLTINKNDIFSTENIVQPNLECLELNYNQIKEVTGMTGENLPLLKNLELRGNTLFTTDGFDYPTLVNLYLAENLINKLEGLDKLVNLKILHLRENPLASLDGITAELRRLEYLNLRKCHVEDLIELRKLTVLPSLKTLIIMENPFESGAEEEYRVEVLVFLPGLLRIDKNPVLTEELEEATELREERENEGSSATPGDTTADEDDD